MVIKTASRVIAIVSSSLLFAFFVGVVPGVSAHSGRTNSSGCHNCNVGSCAGTYHCHGGGSGGGSSYVPSYNYAPRYYLPAPDVPKNGNWTFTKGTKDKCATNVRVTWDKTVSSDRFSVAMSKTQAADPGPSPDTAQNYIVFEDVKPGKWYVNIKAGNAERWSLIYYWDVDVPSQKPSLTAKVKGDSIEYSTQCATKLTTLPSLDKYSSIDKGSYELDFDEITDITLTATNQYGDKVVRKLKYDPNPPTPTPTLETTPIPNIITDEDFEGDTDTLIAGAVLGATPFVGGYFALKLLRMMRKK